MKTIFLFAFSMFFFTTQAQQWFNPGHAFRVEGDAIVRVQPDQVIFNLGVHSRHKLLSKVKEENFKIMKSVVQHCKDRGIADKYIQTDYVRIAPHYDYSEALVDFYKVQQSISIVLEDLSIYESLLSELMELGLNQVHNIEFRTTEIKKYRMEARKLAIEAAKEKAHFLADEVDIKLKKIININERVTLPENSFSRRNYANFSQNMHQTGGFDAHTEGISAGMLSIKAFVTLSYELEE